MTPTTGLTTTEAGGTATFTVVLNTQPTANVTIALSSSNTTEGHGQPGEPDLYDRELEHGADGDGDGRGRPVVDGPITYTIVTAAAASTDADLQRRERGRRRGDQHRQRRGGDHGHADDGLATTEAGGTATFTVVLNTQPTADVTIALSSSNTTEGTVAPGEPDLYDRELEHGADGDGDGRGRRRWSTGRHLHDRDGGGGEHRPELQRRDAADVAVTNSDNDTAGITVTPTPG